MVQFLRFHKLLIFYVIHPKHQTIIAVSGNLYLLSVLFIAILRRIYCYFHSTDEEEGGTLGIVASLGSTIGKLENLSNTDSFDPKLLKLILFLGHLASCRKNTSFKVRKPEFESELCNLVAF